MILKDTTLLEENTYKIFYMFGYDSQTAISNSKTSTLDYMKLRIFHIAKEIKRVKR